MELEFTLSKDAGPVSAAASNDTWNSIIANIESEVLAVAIATARRLNGLLSCRSKKQRDDENHIVLRFGQTRIADAILDLCEIKQSARSSIYASVSKMMSKLIYVAFCEGGDVSALTDDLIVICSEHLTEPELKAFRPFIAVVMKQHIDPFLVLKELEEEFYHHESIIKLQRQMNPSVSVSLAGSVSIMTPKDIKRVRLTVREFDTAIKELRLVFTLTLFGLHAGTFPSPRLRRWLTPASISQVLEAKEEKRKPRII